MVLEKYPKLRKENVIGKLTVKIAKECFFGDEVLRQCTMMGCRNFPALPYMRSMSSSKLFFPSFQITGATQLSSRQRFGINVLIPLANCARDSEMKTVL